MSRGESQGIVGMLVQTERDSGGKSLRDSGDQPPREKNLFVANLLFKGKLPQAHNWHVARF